MNEGLGVADFQTKCDTFFNKGGELAILATSSSGKKGLQPWSTANSPRRKDTALP